jgi:hypothetical protein
MLSKLHNLNLKLCSKQYNKYFALHLIVAPQLGSSWQHYYSTKTRQARYGNEQSMYSLMSMLSTHIVKMAPEAVGVVDERRHSFNGPIFAIIV